MLDGGMAIVLYKKDVINQYTHIEGYVLLVGMNKVYCSDNGTGFGFIEVAPYKDICSLCHGTGVGKPNPRDVTVQCISCLGNGYNFIG